MAISVRKDVDELVLALSYVLNAMQSQVQTDGYHRDLTQITSAPILDYSNITVTNVTVSAPTAVDLPTTIFMANQVLAVLGNLHMPDDQVHLIKDGYNNPIVNDGYVNAVDLPSVEALLNGLTSCFVAHLTQSGVHVHNDNTTYAGLTTPATNLTSSENLANSLKAAVNTHMANAGTSLICPRIKIVSM